MSCKHMFCFLSVSMAASIPEYLSSRLLCCGRMASLQSCSCCFNNLSEAEKQLLTGRILDFDWLFLFFSPFVSLQVSDITEQRHQLYHIQQVVTIVTYHELQ